MQNRVSLAEADREFFLAIYERAVEFYQPRIEKKTGVRLGRIHVSDISQYRSNAKQNARRSALQRVRAFIFAKQFRAAAEIAKARDDKLAASCSAVYFNSGIYVSFAGRAQHENYVASTVVHELSHALWERLGAPPLTWRPRAELADKYRLFVEGFATYAERIWFLDIYPPSVRPFAKHAMDTEGVHYKGLRKIQALVKEFGPEILPQLPRKWESFD